MQTFISSLVMSKIPIWLFTQKKCVDLTLELRKETVSKPLPGTRLLREVMRDPTDYVATRGHLSLVLEMSFK